MYEIARPGLRPFRAARPRSPWPARIGRAALVAGAVLLLSFGLARAAEGGAQGTYEPVTVRAGDTLWSIASDRYPGADVRVKVYQIELANRMAGPALYPGETLLVPTR